MVGWLRVIHSAVPDRDKLLTLVAGKRRRLLLTWDDDEVFMTRRFNVTPKTTERSGKFEAEVTDNNCIGDDTKAAARQSPNCIKKNKNKIKYGEKRFSIWRMEFLHPEMWHDHDIDFAMQVTAPCNVACGSGMTCHWIRPNAAILEFYIWFRFLPYHRSRHVILHQSAIFYPNRTTLSRKKWRHVDFQDGGHLGF